MVRVYVGVGSVDDAKRAVDRGFTAVKTSPQPPGSDALPWGKVLREAGRKMEALRKALGDEIDIALDPHAKIFEPARALELAEVVRPYRPMFLKNRSGRKTCKPWPGSVRRPLCPSLPAKNFTPSTSSTT